MTTNLSRRLRRVLVALPVTGLVLTTGALPAAAAPTCSEVDFLDVEVHGHHVVRDYVTGGVSEWPPPGGSVGAAIGGTGAVLPGGPGPGFHFPNGVAPGASFCNGQSQSPGFHVP